MKTPQKTTLRYRGFEKVYKDLALPVYKFLVKKTGGNTELADEVSSRTFEAALKGWDKFGHKSTYFTWVCKIALNKLADYYRDRIHEESHLFAPFLEEVGKLPDKKLNPEEKLALKELKESVQGCLDLLPEETKNLIYLRYWEELSLKKISEITGMSERSVEGKIYRGKIELRLALEKSYPEYSPSKS